MRHFITFILLILCFQLYAKEYEYTIHLPSLLMEKQMIQKEEFVSFKGKDCFPLGSVGCPEILWTTIRYYIPSNEMIENVSLKNMIQKKLSLNARLCPIQPARTTSDIIMKDTFIINSRSYDFEGSIPMIDTIQYKLQKIGNQKVLEITIPCFYYKSCDNSVIMNISGTIDIKTISCGRETNNNQHINDIVQNIVQNPELLQSLNTINQQNNNSINIDLPYYEYTIITNDSLKSAFLDFIHWKHMKGINIGVVTMEEIIGSEQIIGDIVSNIYDNVAKLRQYLKYGYDNDLLSYVLLGGDSVIVPFRYGNAYDNNIEDLYHIPSDLYLSEFESNWDVDRDNIYGEPYNDNISYMPVLPVGRLLCSNSSEIKKWVKKLIIYEKNPGNGDFDYLTRALFTESDQMQDGQEAEQIQQNLPNYSVTILREDLLNPISPTFPYGSDIINALNNTHYGLYTNFNHGHGTYFTTTTSSLGSQIHNDHGVVAKDYFDTRDDIAYYIYPENLNGLDNLTNYNYPFIWYSISCHNMPFDTYQSSTGKCNLGEAFLFNSQGGGIAFLGNTRSGYVRFSTLLYEKFIYALQTQSNHIGEAEMYSKLWYNNSFKHDLLLAHNLLGCPETPMWTNTPQQFTNISMSYINNNLTINTDIDNVKICVTSAWDYGESYFAVALVNDNYTFYNVPENYHIVITKENYIPFIYEQPIYIQNETIDETKSVIASTILIGDHVTDTKNYGNVEILEGGSLNIQTSKQVVIDTDFYVKEGSELNIYGQ